MISKTFTPSKANIWCNYLLYNYHWKTRDSPSCVCRRVLYNITWDGWVYWESHLHQLILKTKHPALLFFVVCRIENKNFNSDIRKCSVCIFVTMLGHSFLICLTTFHFKEFQRSSIGKNQAGVMLCNVTLCFYCCWVCFFFCFFFWKTKIKAHPSHVIL